MGMDGSGNGKSSVGGSGDDKGNGPGPGWDGSCRWQVPGSGRCSVIGRGVGRDAVLVVVVGGWVVV